MEKNKTWLNLNSGKYYVFKYDRPSRGVVTVIGKVVSVVNNEVGPYFGYDKETFWFDTRCTARHNSDYYEVIEITEVEFWRQLHFWKDVKGVPNEASKKHL